MSGWEVTYGLLVLQVTLLASLAGGAYLVGAPRDPVAAKRLLGVAIVLILGLTVVAGLPLPGFWALDIWSEQVVVARPPQPPSPTLGTIENETETFADLTGPSWADVAEPERPPAASSDTARSSEASPAATEIPWTRALALFLLAGAAIVGIRLAWSLWLTCRVVARSSKVTDARIVGPVDAIRRSIGCRRVELRVSPEITSAATVGWRRPVLIVAEDWQQWTELELRAVLAHEMMHVGSNDYITGLIARVTDVLYFYHPLVRWLGARLALAQEAAADAAAAQLVGGRADYLAALSRIALRQDRQVRSLPVLAFATSFSTALMRRIEILKTKEGRRSNAMRFFQGAVVACLCVAAIGVSALRAPADDETEPEATVGAVDEEAAPSISEIGDTTKQEGLAKQEQLPPLPRSVTYKSIYVHDGRPSSASRVMQLGTDRYRSESEGGRLSISNRETSIHFDHEQKQAFIVVRPREQSESLGLFGGYRKLLTDPHYEPEKKREVLGESEIDGRRVVGHRITNNRAIIKLWVDPDSLLPVQIERVSRTYPNMKSIQTDFVYNVDLDESLFNVEPPDDYTVYRERVRSGPGTENDLIESFRQFREHQKAFPDALDGSSVGDLIRKKSQTLGDKPTPAQYEEFKRWAPKVWDGIGFVDSLQPPAEAHYAGKGVSVTAGDTPIFWYRPEGSENYRVIRADLSVIEVETPPEVPGAQSISDWGQDERADQRPWRNIAAAYNVQNLAPLVRKMGILPFSLRNELKIRVIPGSAAEEAGLRTGDRVTALRGVHVERVEHVAALWALLPYYAKVRPSVIDEGVSLKVLREGGQEVEVTLPGDLLRSFLSPSGEDTWDEQALLSLARQIGIEPDSDGLTVNDVVKVRVLPGSAAEQAGIRSGDQITALNGEKVLQLKDLVALMAWVPLDEDTQALAAKQGVQLTLIREGETIEATLPGEVFRALKLPPASDDR